MIVDYRHRYSVVLAQLMTVYSTQCAHVFHASEVPLLFLTIKNKTEEVGARSDYPLPFEK